MRDRIVGAFLGLACGDALGAPAEFKDAAEVRKRWGVLMDMVGGGPWQPGEWTDDTSMAICVAEGILANPEFPREEIGARFLPWYEIYKNKDVGNTTRSAITGFMKLGSWPQAASSTPQAATGKAASNGSLMRTLPIPLAYPDAGRMLRRSAKVSAMTHWDSRAEVCCAIYGLWIHHLLNGAPMNIAWEAALHGAEHAYRSGQPLTSDTPGPCKPKFEHWKRLHTVAERKYTDLQPTGYAGFVVDCLEAAVWCCLHARSLEQALVLAVNLGGEADTIAAVTGGAAGAHWGASAIPARWLDVVRDTERIESLAVRLHNLRTHAPIYETEGLKKKLFEFNEVFDRVFAGRHPLTARDVETLADSGITHVLDLREPQEWSGPGRFGVEALREMENRGIVRRHLRLTDAPAIASQAPKANDFDMAWDLLNGWMTDPAARVYVHCRAGLERTGCVLIACYARKHGLTYDAAKAELSKQRNLQPMKVQEVAARAWIEAHAAREGLNL